jgi:hypothetical protein
MRGMEKRRNRFYPVFSGLPPPHKKQRGAKDKVSIYKVKVNFFIVAFK